MIPAQPVLTARPIKSFNRSITKVVMPTRCTWRILNQTISYNLSAKQKLCRLSPNGITLTTLVDAFGNPVELMLSPGQTNDLICAEALLAGFDPALIGDKAYDADILIDFLAQRANHAGD